MATWDGSCPAPEDPNYYVYSDRDIAGPPAENWQYYSNNVNGAFLQANREYYMPSEPVYEQNCRPTYYPVDGNVSSVPMNVVPLANNFHDQQLVGNIMENARLTNNLEYYPSAAESPISYTAVPQRNNKYDAKAKHARKNNKPAFSRDGNARSKEQSNLDSAANEFVPNGNKPEREQSKPEIIDNGSLSINAQNAGVEDSGSRSRSLDKFRDRGKHERRYDNKGNSGYRNKDGQYDQFQKGMTYKNSYRQQNGRGYGRPQGDKYFNNRRHLNESQQNMHEVNPRRSTTNRANKYGNQNDQDGTLPLSNAREDESLNIAELNENTDFSRNFTNDGNFASKDDTEQTSRAGQCSTHAREFNAQGSSSRQNYSRNTRKYPANTKYDRYENNYREKKYNHQGYNGVRENYNKENKTESYKERDRSKNVVETEDKTKENWRSKKENDEKPSTQKRRQFKKYTIDDDASQRERLSEQLNRGILECLVCCEYIKQNDYVWSCSNCYHVLHLKCIKKWAKSSQGENGWRCPACQNANLTIPEEYFCFCGKMKTPEWNRRDTAHSCGEICGRTLSKNNCVHKCTLLCHPGSCPVCIAMVTKYCGCGRTSQTLQCSTNTSLLCDSICERELNCGRHKCERKCHDGECERCEKALEQVCFCGKNKREVTCQKDVPLTYACDGVCGKLLDCGNHTCTKLCHQDDCEPCSLTPDNVMTCCCGQTPLTEERKSCLDPVPTCGKICSRNLKCGQPSNPHKCKANCHEGDCPDCDLTTDVKCRCGNMDREIACKDLRTKADDARCEKRCVKKRSCGKHKCNQLCCIDIEHICPLPCSKTLSCGRHKCEQSCHKGRCQPCWRSSFEELYCECGAAVIYPPVPCGTRRPACDRPCSRQHSCGHEVLHNCHSEPTCPPCSVLTQRWCHGKHELRKAVPCYFEEISCGLACNKPLSCGRHKCVTICHPGSCEKPGQQCTQPCTVPREMCGHICAAPCHDGKCPDTPCKEIVKVTCQCGHRTMSRACAENSKEYQRIASNILASKMADMQLGHTIDLEEVFGQGAKRQNQLKTLECNDECKLIERNRRLALGLQIVNPDLSGKLMPRYSDFMKQWAKKDPHFCQMVHDKLTELVQLAKTSKQKSRSYSFDSMNWEKRHFVHESCEHFGCESQAYDHEPKRNVVATAVKDKCWLPSYSLLEIVQRENGQRKVPGPMLNSSRSNGSVKTVLSLPVRKSQPPATPTSLKATEKEPEIDYFDYQG